VSIAAEEHLPRNSVSIATATNHIVIVFNRYIKIEIKHWILQNRTYTCLLYSLKFCLM